jgi:formylglycine-generating enzyme required for sulfatase activity
LYDMAGNVWEWCYDGFDTYPTEATIDPIEASKDTCRVFRGGGWTSSALSVRAAQRDCIEPTARSNVLGFRVVRSGD